MYNNPFKVRINVLSMAELKSRLNNGDRASIAELFHRQFVDEMWPRFGLTAHPGYALIEILPLFAEGFNDKPVPTIFLADHLTAYQIKNLTYHGSGHFLDPFRRKLWKKYRKEISKSDYFFGEIVANLATRIYLSFSEGNEAAVQPALYETSLESREEPCYCEMLSLDLFESDKSILEKLANIGPKEARKLILPHLKQRLDLRKDPYS